MEKTHTKRLIAALLAFCVAAATAAWLAVPHLGAWVDRLLNRTRGPPPRVTAQQQAFHQSLHVADLHADPLLWNRNLLEHSPRGHVDVPRMRAGNVMLQVLGAPTWVPVGQNMQRNVRLADVLGVLAGAYGWPDAARHSAMARAGAMAHNLAQAVAASDRQVRWVKTAADLDALVADHDRDANVVGVLLATEGAYPVEDHADGVARLYGMGYRMVGLAHFVDSAVAGSAHGWERHGLTPLGHAVVAQAEARGMTVDLAHASPAAVADTLAVATRPVVVSHTGLVATCPGPRNLTDAQLAAVAARGGVVGVGFFEVAVCQLSVAGIVAALRHAVAVMGVDHVALGSDWDGGVVTPVDAAGVGAISAALLDSGMAPQDVAAIMGENVLRVLRSNLAAATNPPTSPTAPIPQ